MDNNLKNNLKSLPFMKLIKDLSDELQIEVYLVGGVIRDLVMGCVSTRDRSLDLDFAVNGDALLFGKIVGDKIDGSYFPLDEERSVSRVVIRQSPVTSHQSSVIIEEIILDFSRIRGGSIEDDLKLRDFTINSIAVSLDNLFDDKDLYCIDPTDGIADIKNKLIRAYDKRVIDDDPLRMLRAIRFESQLDFLAGETLEGLIKENGYKIKNSSGERVRDELFNILSCHKSHIYVQRLKDLNILKEIFPEIESMENLEQGRHHKYFLWEHSINTLKTLEILIENLQRIFSDKYLKIHEILSNNLEHGISNREVLKLSSLIHDIGKPWTKDFSENKNVHFINHESFSEDIAKKLCRRLRLGNNICKSMTSIVRNHMRPILLSKEQKVTNRAIFRFFRDTKDEGILICLLSIADIHATRGAGIFDDIAEDIEGLARRMIVLYFEDFTKQFASPLISGGEIMEKFNLKSGPEIGELLKEIEECRAEGIISNKEEALKFLESNKSILSATGKYF